MKASEISHTHFRSNCEFSKTVKSQNHGIGNLRESFSWVHLESSVLINVDHIFFSRRYDHHRTSSFHFISFILRYENRQQQRFVCRWHKKYNKINTKSNQTVTKRRQRWKRNQTRLELEWHQAIKSILLSFRHTDSQYQCLFSCFSFVNRIFGVYAIAHKRDRMRWWTRRLVDVSLLSE